MSFASGGAAEPVRMLGDHIRLLLADDGEGHRVPDTVQFLDEGGTVIRSVPVFPPAALRRGQVRTFLSPKGEFLGIFTVYTLGDEAGRQGNFSLYDRKGAVLWQETENNVTGIDRLTRRRCYPRDDGSVCLFFPEEGKWEIHDRMGRDVGSLLLDPWRRESGDVRWSEVWEPERRYVALARSMRDNSLYELSYIDIDAGRLLWTVREKGRGGNVLGFFPDSGVILVGESSGGDDNPSLSAFGTDGRSLWSRKVKGPVQVSGADDRPGVLRIEYFEVDTASFGAEAGQWRRAAGSELVDARTGEIIESDHR
ncbi:MAG: hypothetical protein JSV26_11230 [bacterium]|nr:MAG: hypothetical protein JSV26_11230 [bacterium]